MHTMPYLLSYSITTTINGIPIYLSSNRNENLNRKKKTKNSPQLQWELEDFSGGYRRPRGKGDPEVTRPGIEKGGRSPGPSTRSATDSYKWIRTLQKLMIMKRPT